VLAERLAGGGSEAGHHVEDAVGRPASWKMCARSNVVRGVCSEGFTTVVQPDASTGASSCRGS